ncbi:MAG TPA: hypothetical protein VLM40_06730 [Gemmata sp.]|nr:hypothetical protein [Gemmata sp.]
MTHHFRIAVSATALAAGLWYFTSAAAAPPMLSKDCYKRLIEGDIAQVKTQLKWISANPEDFNAKAAAWTVKTLAFTLVSNAEATGDSALRDESLKLVEATTKLSDSVKPRPKMRVIKDVVDRAQKASAIAEKLAFKPGPSPLQATEPYKIEKYDYELAQVMTLFRPSDRGGTNIEKDIRDMIKKDNPLKVNPAAVELLASRTASVGYLIHAFPNDKAKAKPNDLKEWNQLTKDMVEISQKIAAEAAKGTSANDKELVKMLDALNGKCYKCHSDYRDE